MLRLHAPVTLRLDRGALLAWPRQSGVRLRVLAGTLWITQANDLQDHFLQPGQTLTLRPGARALVGAEVDAVLCFESDAGLGLARLWQRLRAARGARAAAPPRSAHPA